jgi:hypothetical protein
LNKETKFSQANWKLTMQAWADPKGVSILIRYNITVMWLGESHSRSKNLGQESEYPEWLLCSFLPSLQAHATLVPQIMPHSLLLTSFSVHWRHYQILKGCVATVYIMVEGLPLMPCIWEDLSSCINQKISFLDSLFIIFIDILQLCHFFQFSNKCSTYQNTLSFI